jgi:hypothetical protein
MPRAAVLALVLVASVASGCGGSQDEAAPPAVTVAETSAPAGRPAAPELEGTSLEGESISLGDLRGRPVLVNVWSSW